MKLNTIIDTFVNLINQSPDMLDALEERDVPAFLRLGDPNEYGSYRWEICLKDGTLWINPLMEQLPKRFPPSYYSFVSRYAFATLNIPPIIFFANTGEQTPWELSTRIFHDPYMSPRLLQAGFLQIGAPNTGAYDPICFDTRQGTREYPIIQIDHESLLCHSIITMTKNIAPSFLTFVTEYIAHTQGTSE